MTSTATREPGYPYDLTPRRPGSTVATLVLLVGGIVVGLLILVNLSPEPTVPGTGASAPGLTGQVGAPAPRQR